ncbi:MAG: chromophore lyase CpcT/CpeT [Synechococcales bacterium]|nr:chromophore lyase CpcT/CpeT [Synechococcales bacterium]
MSIPATPATLVRLLAGEFINREQALAQPAWFVSLRLWHRPLPRLLMGNPAIFAEQANALYPDQAYRQRLLMVQKGPEGLEVQYFALRRPEVYKGAGLAPERLRSLQDEDLIRLPGCVLEVQQQGETFIAKMHPGERCQFEYQGKVGQVALGFEASLGRFRSYDRGVDPETGRSLWGALMGPYEFTQQADYATDVPLYPEF